MGLEDAFPFGKAVYFHQTKQCVTTSMFGRLQWTRNSVASKIWSFQWDTGCMRLPFFLVGVFRYLWIFYLYLGEWSNFTTGWFNNPTSFSLMLFGPSFQMCLRFLRQGHLWHVGNVGQRILVDVEQLCVLLFFRYWWILKKPIFELNTHCWKQANKTCWAFIDWLPQVLEYVEFTLGILVTAWLSWIIPHTIHGIVYSPTFTI